MRSNDIPQSDLYQIITFEMDNLMERVDSGRSNWKDLPKGYGVYIVYWPDFNISIEFNEKAGKATYASPVKVDCLKKKWESINHFSKTDILYIGKGKNLRQRISLFIRFGRGKVENHKGGEWIWQINEIEKSVLLVQKCDNDREFGYENSLLEKFCADHGNWPLANRTGPRGNDRWWPNTDENILKQ